jgi:hypothetical protein
MLKIKEGDPKNVKEVKEKLQKHLGIDSLDVKTKKSNNGSFMAYCVIGENTYEGESDVEDLCYKALWMIVKSESANQAGSLFTYRQKVTGTE